MLLTRKIYFNVGVFITNSQNNSNCYFLAFAIILSLLHRLYFVFVILLPLKRFNFN